MTVNEQRMTLSKRAHRRGLVKVWPKMIGCGVARLDHGACHGASPSALHPNILGHKRDLRMNRPEVA